MDKFDKAELDGRSLFKEILQQCNIADFRDSLEKFDTLDMYCNILSRKLGVEIKKRAKKYELYDTYLMELIKFNALVDRVKKGELDTIYYVNFFGEDTCYIFSLRLISAGIKDGKVKIDSTYANRTTSELGEKVYKRMLYLPKEIGLRLVKIDGKWINPNKKQ